MLPRRAAAEVRAADDYGVLRLGLVGLHEARRIVGWEAAHRVRAELLVLGGIGWNQGQVLGRDDLVRVDVIADDIAKSVKCGGRVGRRERWCCGGA